MNTKLIVEDCLINMFEAVGLLYTFAQIEDYAKQDNWYTLQTWSKEQEEEFVSWMDAELKERTPWNKKTRAKEIGFFLLQWGWKRN